jgi:hypothetical protein
MSRLLSKKRTKLSLPAYKETDEKPNQPVLDPFSSISETVVLDDVKILKANIIRSNNFNRTILFKTFVIGVQQSFMNGEVSGVVTAKTPKNYDGWTSIYASYDWKDYFSYTTTPYTYTFKKAGLYEIKGQFGVNNTNDRGFITLYFSNKGPKSSNTIQVYSLQGNNAIEYGVGTDAFSTSISQIELIPAGSTLTIETSSTSAGSRWPWSSHLQLTYIGEMNYDAQTLL